MRVGLTLSCSQGQTGGRIRKLQLLRRQTYGGARSTSSASAPSTRPDRTERAGELWKRANRTILIVSGLSLIRLGEWFAGTPRRRARPSPFACLPAEPVAARGGEGIDMGFAGTHGNGATPTSGWACSPHCANRSRLQVFTLHLAAAMPACHDLQEWHAKPDAAREEFNPPRLRLVDGEVAVPTGPGWGVELVPGFLDRATLRFATA